MSNLQIIDMLCAITMEQAEIIKGLMLELEHNKQISDELKKQYRNRVKETDREMDVVEFHCRKIIDTDDIEKEE